MARQEEEDLFHSMGGVYSPEYYKVLHKRKWEDWVKEHDVVVLDSLPDLSELRVGDTVTFTNSYGTVFHGITVLGFVSPTDKLNETCPDNVVYLDYDCYWFPAKLKHLIKE